MPEKEKPETDKDGGSSTATAPPPPKQKQKPLPKNYPPGLLPQWKVLLHNDDHNGMEFVVLSIMELTPLNEQESTLRTLEAHRTGVALLLITHKERAELYMDQFTSKGLTVTIEPDEK